MPIISVRIIRNPRKQRYCDDCSRHLDGETIRMYGMACSGDKPYPLFLHRECIVSKDALSMIRAVELPDETATSDPCPYCDNGVEGVDEVGNMLPCPRCDGTGQR